MVTGALDAARELVAAGERGVMATAVAGREAGTTVLLDAGLSVVAGSSPPAEVEAAAGAVLEAGSPRVVSVGEVEWFIEPVVPHPRLIVLGAVSVADALVPMAIAAGFDVTVVDSRDWLARPERYPGAEVHCGHPPEVFEGIGVDAATSVVSFLHEARLEDAVLIAALRGRAAYVGSMGSRKTTAAKRERLREAGLSPDEEERLHAPIGLNLGSRTPQEIAVSVLAEMVAARRGLA